MKINLSLYYLSTSRYNHRCVDLLVKSIIIAQKRCFRNSPLPPVDVNTVQVNNLRFDRRFLSSEYFEFMTDQISSELIAINLLRDQITGGERAINFFSSTLGNVPENVQSRLEGLREQLVEHVERAQVLGYLSGATDDMPEVNLRAWTIIHNHISVAQRENDLADYVNARLNNRETSIDPSIFTQEELERQERLERELLAVQERVENTSVSTSEPEAEQMENTSVSTSEPEAEQVENTSVSTSEPEAEQVENTSVLASQETDANQEPIETQQERSELSQQPISIGTGQVNSQEADNISQEATPTAETSEDLDPIESIRRLFPDTVNQSNFSSSHSDNTQESQKNLDSETKNPMKRKASDL